MVNAMIQKMPDKYLITPTLKPNAYLMAEGVDARERFLNLLVVVPNKETT